MKMYFANNMALKIEAHEVERETDHFVWVINGNTSRREGKRTDYGAWFGTHEEAKNHLINRVNNEIVRHTILLESANKEMVKVNLL
jgi:hypothetical protein